MRNHSEHGKRSAPIRRPAVIKYLAILLFLSAVIRLAVALGANSAAEGFMHDLVQNRGVVMQILSFESGNAENIPTELSALFQTDPEAEPDDTVPVPQTTAPPEAPNDLVSPPPSQLQSPSQGFDPFAGGELFYTGGETPDVSASPEPSAPPPVLPESQPPTPPKSAGDLLINNKTKYAIDIPSLFAQPLGIRLTKGEPAVLIIHTHSSEAYTPSGGDTYAESDPYRTEDKTQSVERVGDELASQFESRGISVIHDRGIYDYPSYVNSYSNAYAAIQADLKKYPSIKLVIDLHRDAIAAADGSQYKTIAQIGDVTCSQVMMVVGTDSAGLTDPNWRENLKLALHIQYEMDALYPTLSRPVEISQYRYNMQATAGSLLVEVGCAGNTLQESLGAVKYFADAASNVILDFYK